MSEHDSRLTSGILLRAALKLRQSQKKIAVLTFPKSIARRESK